MSFLSLASAILCREILYKYDTKFSFENYENVFNDYDLQNIFQKNKIDYLEENDIITIRINAKKSIYFSMFIIVLIITFFKIIIMFAGNAILQIVWCGIMFLLFYNLLWYLIGKETIILNKSELILKSNFFKTEIYKLSEIVDIRMEDSVQCNLNFGWLTENIELEIKRNSTKKNSIEHFGKGLNFEIVQAIIKVIKMRLVKLCN